MFVGHGVFWEVECLMDSVWPLSTQDSEACSAMNGFSGSGFKMGAVVNSVLSFSKASSVLVFHARCMGPFFSSDIRGVAMELKPWVNRRNWWSIEIFGPVGSGSFGDCRHFFLVHGHSFGAYVISQERDGGHVKLALFSLYIELVVKETCQNSLNMLNVGLQREGKINMLLTYAITNFPKKSFKVGGSIPGPYASTCRCVFGQDTEPSALHDTHFVEPLWLKGTIKVQTIYQWWCLRPFSTRHPLWCGQGCRHCGGPACGRGYQYFTVIWMSPQ